MFNLYSSLGREGAPGRESPTIGHDRFGARPASFSGSPRSSRRRRRPPPARRTRSAADLYSPRGRAAAAAAGAMNTPPSTPPTQTPTQRPHSDERTPLLARFFSCVSLTTPQPQAIAAATAAAASPSGDSSPTTPRACGVRHGGRYEYTALEADAGHERLQQERKARERARGACLHYLRSCPRYALLHHLNDIGSRVDKHWFVVRDASVKTERLLTLVPRATACPLAPSPAIRHSLLELFHALQHPYIYPVLDLDFRETTGQSYVILVLPFNGKGSLKDLIYKSRWQDDWSQKYGQRSEGLPTWQVQRLGRQILEALLFLRERGFPPFGHLHSGNVILQNGVARLTGLENALLGHTSRVHPVVWALARSDPNAVDVVCFGHVLFEMCAGYELCAPRPSAGQLADVAGYPAVQDILQRVFLSDDGRFPPLQELLLLDFFRSIDLREMRAAPLPVRTTQAELSSLPTIPITRPGTQSRRRADGWGERPEIT